MAAVGLRCRECGKSFPVSPVYACDDCFGPLEVVYDFGRVSPEQLAASIASGPKSIWRYAQLLP
ncbi:MAG: threonine synthase, partial [Bacillota bacterium]